MSRTAAERKAIQDGYRFTGIYARPWNKEQLDLQIARHKEEKPNMRFRKVDVGSGISVYEKYLPFKDKEIPEAKNTIAALGTTIKGLRSAKTDVEAQIRALQERLGSLQNECTQAGRQQAQLLIRLQDTGIDNTEWYDLDNQKPINPTGV